MKPVPSHPGALLREVVFPSLGRSLTVIASDLRISRYMLGRILREERPVTAAIAVKLGKYLGNGPTIWIGMQTAHDLAVAQRSLASALKKIPNVNHNRAAA